MEAGSNFASGGASALVGVAVLVILGAMGAGWLLRALLLRTLEKGHPEEFARLGRPSSRQLASLMPRFREMQLEFWKYLWEGRVFGLKDRRLTALAVAALACDVVLVAGVVLIAWRAWA